MNNKKRKSHALTKLEIAKRKYVVPKPPRDDRQWVTVGILNVDGNTHEVSVYARSLAHACKLGEVYGDVAYIKET